MKNKDQIIIYKTEDGYFEVDVTLTGDTVWLSQKQMTKLFGTERSVITKHINNIFKQKELNKRQVCAKFAHTAEDGKTYQTVFYNLDVIIAVGYRVNAKRGTQFRIWATKTLKEHLLQGYSINHKKLTEIGTRKLESVVEFIKQASNKRHLTNEEAQGLLDIIAKYAKSWLLLRTYDENDLPATKGHVAKFMFSYDAAKEAIESH